MKNIKKSIIYTIIVAILYSYTGSVYLGNYYRLTNLASAAAAEFFMMRCGYFLQAIGMFLFAVIYKKNNRLINSVYGKVALIGLSLIPMSIVQTTTIVSLLVVSSFFFNLLTGMILEMYLVELAYNCDKKHIALCYGIAYAFGSLFTFLVTYFDGGKFMESPSMVIVYILMVAVSAILLLKGKPIKVKEEILINDYIKKYIVFMSLCIIGTTILVALGDGIYNFGRWSSDADIRVVRAFYAVGLVLAGLIFDISRKAGFVLTISFMSYYIISAFLLDNAISPSVMMSLGYFFMAFMSVYRYMAIVDLTYAHPQLIPCAGFGLMISRVAEGLTSLLMMLFPLSLTSHIIVSLLFYSPLVIIAIITDNIKINSSSISSNQYLSKQAEKYGLTSREQEIVKLVLENASDDEIANKLYISKSTVRFHISNILKKTKTKNRVETRRLFEK